MLIEEHKIEGKIVFFIIFSVMFSLDFWISYNTFPVLYTLLLSNKIILFLESIALYTVLIFSFSTWVSVYVIIGVVALIIKKNKKEINILNSEDLPEITIQIPIRNEPFEIVVNNSIKSALSINYPKSKIKILVIDNSDRGKYESIEKYCNENAITFIHRDGIQGAKARNLNIGLGLKPLDSGLYHQINSDYVFLVDSDIAFPEDILCKAISEFNNNKDLAFITFEVQDLAKDNLFNYSLASLNSAKSFLVVILNNLGFATTDGYGIIYKRSIWNAIDGWIEDNVGEDWATGIKLRTMLPKISKGMKISSIKVTDRSPNTLYRLKIQQKRWAKGTAQTILKLLPKFLLAKHIAINEKIDLFIRLMSYPILVLSWLISPFFISVLEIIRSICKIEYNYTVLQPILDTYKAFSYFFILSIALNFLILLFNQQFKDSLKYIFLYIIGLFSYCSASIAVFEGLYEGFLGRDKNFNITPKSKQNNHRNFSNNKIEIFIGIFFLIIGYYIVTIEFNFIFGIGFGYLLSPFLDRIKNKMIISYLGSSKKLKI